MHWLRAWLKGTARALDLGATLTPESPDLPGPAQDALALQGDWQRVGDDMSRALGEARRGD
jgi:hypothetical protein